MMVYVTFFQLLQKELADNFCQLHVIRVIVKFHVPGTKKTLFEWFCDCYYECTLYCI